LKYSFISWSVISLSVSPMSIFTVVLPSGSKYYLKANFSYWATASPILERKFFFSLSTSWLNLRLYGEKLVSFKSVLILYKLKLSNVGNYDWGCRPYLSNSSLYMYSSTDLPLILNSDEQQQEVYPSITGDIWVNSAPISTTIPLYYSSENNWRLGYLTKEILLHRNCSKQNSARYDLISSFSSKLASIEFSENVRFKLIPSGSNNLSIELVPQAPPFLIIFSISTSSVSFPYFCNVHGSINIF